MFAVFGLGPQEVCVLLAVACALIVPLAFIVILFIVLKNRPPAGPREC